jgi:glycosyltransferase involved in cell wall biosynthesis
MLFGFFTLVIIYLFWIKKFFKNRGVSFYLLPSILKVTKDISSPLVSIIIPARNEKKNIGRCLSSIINQTYKNYEIVVVDDESEDNTAGEVEEIQRKYGGIKLLRTGGLPVGWTGKNYALHLGIKEAIGDWLLFLDADTELYPEAISRVLNFGLSNNIGMVSFSPEQVLCGFWELAIQPVIFEFLSSRYDYNRINDPNREIAAANGQFILIQRGAYEEVGGHEAVKDEILEDVALARNVKRRGKRLYFSYGEEIVRCRMYKSLREIIQGWTKNLVILLGYEWRTLFRVVLSLVFFSLLPLILFLYSLLLLFIEPSFLHALFFILTLCLGILIILTQWNKFRRLKYPKAAAFLYPLGVGGSIILFLLSAYRNLVGGEVKWKGRKYSVEKKD